MREAGMLVMCAITYVSYYVTRTRYMNLLKQIHKAIKRYDGHARNATEQLVEAYKNKIDNVGDNAIDTQIESINREFDESIVRGISVAELLKKEDIRTK